MSKIQFTMLDNYGDRIEVKQNGDNELLFYLDGEAVRLSFVTKTDAMYMRLFCDQVVRRSGIDHHPPAVKYAEHYDNPFPTQPKSTGCCDSWRDSTLPKDQHFKPE